MVILVDHSGDDAFSADRPQVGHVPDRPRLDVRGLLLPGLVRPVAVATAPRGAVLYARAAGRDERRCLWIRCLTWRRKAKGTAAWQ